VNIHSNITHRSHTWKQSKCSLTVEWINNIYTHTVEDCVLTPARAQTTPRTDDPRVKAARRRRPQTVGFHLFETGTTGTSERQKDQRLSGDKGRGKQAVTANRYVVLSGGIERFQNEQLVMVVQHCGCLRPTELYPSKWCVLGHVNLKR